MPEYFVIDLDDTRIRSWRRLTATRLALVEGGVPSQVDLSIAKAARVRRLIALPPNPKVPALREFILGTTGLDARYSSNLTTLKGAYYAYRSLGSWRADQLDYCGSPVWHVLTSHILQTLAREGGLSPHVFFLAYWRTGAAVDSAQPQQNVACPAGVYTHYWSFT